jgi:hypothetical protein
MGGGVRVQLAAAFENGEVPDATLTAFIRARLASEVGYSSKRANARRGIVLVPSHENVKHCPLEYLGHFGGGEPALPKSPMKPGAIKRATDAKPEPVASRIIWPASISAKLASSTSADMGRARHQRSLRLALDEIIAVH